MEFDTNVEISTNNYSYLQLQSTKKSKRPTKVLTIFSDDKKKFRNCYKLIIIGDKTCKIGQNLAKTAIFRDLPTKNLTP